jgi:glycine betaine/choline ABC-type transport system substrate-binding protein
MQPLWLKGPALVSKLLKSLFLCCAVALSLSAPAAVVVSSKLDSEATMLSQMVRLLLDANGIATIDRTRIGATPVVRKALPGRTSRRAMSARRGSTRLPIKSYG